jgi:hypothetical protein
MTPLAVLARLLPLPPSVLVLWLVRALLQQQPPVQDLGVGANAP